jgi:signal recognition particle subunit SRP14
LIHFYKRDKARKMLLENDLFLSKLTLMFDKSRTKGHVSLCMKRYRYDGRNRPDPKPRKYGKKNSKQQYLAKLPPPSEPPHEPSEYMCLIRAVLNNEKISTVVHAKDVNRFQLAYCNLLKSNMDGLKRQKKQKTKKAIQD